MEGTGGDVVIWTVYDRDTRDYPGKFIARKFLILPGKAIPTQSIILADDLEALRRVLHEMGLDMILQAEPEDDAVILESWM